MISCGKLDLEQMDSKENRQPNVGDPQPTGTICETIITKMHNDSKIRLTTLICIYYDYF